MHTFDLQFVTELAGARVAAARDQRITSLDALPAAAVLGKTALSVSNAVGYSSLTLTLPIPGLGSQ